jgi:hypothetical protein
MKDEAKTDLLEGTMTKDQYDTYTAALDNPEVRMNVRIDNITIAIQLRIHTKFKIIELFIGYS